MRRLALGSTRRTAKPGPELVGAALNEKLDRVGHLVLPLRLCCNEAP